jgi:DNA-binding NtrC family response regulator
MAQLAGRYGRSKLALDSSALAALTAHNWPGNVRELRNVLERAVLLQRSPVLSAEDLMLPPARPAALSTSGTAAVSASLESVEREHLLRALEDCNWNVTQAARKLQISRDTLRYRMDRHGLQR